MRKMHRIFRTADPTYAKATRDRLRGWHGSILAYRLTRTPYKLHMRFIALYEPVLSAEFVVSFVSTRRGRRPAFEYAT
jgi:hypothetical protein